MALDNNKTEDKKRTSVPNSRRQPLKSGKVKGPMGVGKKAGPGTRATVKEPAKGKTSTREEDSGVSRTSADGAVGTGGSSSSNLSPASSPEDQAELNKTPRERLPERTSAEPEALQVVESKRERKEAEASHVLESGETIALSETTETEIANTKTESKAAEDLNNPAPEPHKDKNAAPEVETSNQNNSSKAKTCNQDDPSKAETPNQDDSKPEDIAKKGAKKMSRRKFVKGISAEEKLKLDNISPSEELKSRIAESAMGFWDAID